jgi:hypothetical protein
MSSIGRRRPEGGGGGSGVSSPFERDPSSSSRHYQQQSRHQQQQQQQQRSQHHHHQQQHDHPPLVVRYQNDNNVNNSNNTNTTHYNGNYDNNNQNQNNPAVVESSSRLLSSPVLRPSTRPSTRPTRTRNWSDMTRTIYHYERIEQIGEGTYGQVYRARCKDTNEIVALKKIRVHHGIHWGIPPTVIREIKILKRLVHPNLVRMDEVVSSKGVEYLDTDDYHKGSDRNRSSKNNKNSSNKNSNKGGGQGDDNNDDDYEKSSSTNKNTTQIQITDTSIEDAREAYKGNLFLVLEYVPHDLTGLLDIAYKFNEIEIKCIFKQLLDALAYMHNEKYIHRDIKSSNILIDRNFRLKLADFGLARSIEPPLLDKLHEYVSTQKYIYFHKKNSKFLSSIVLYLNTLLRRYIIL